MKPHTLLMTTLITLSVLGTVFLSLDDSNFHSYKQSLSEVSIF